VPMNHLTNEWCEFTCELRSEFIIAQICFLVVVENVAGDGDQVVTNFRTWIFPHVYYARRSHWNSHSQVGSELSRRIACVFELRTPIETHSLNPRAEGGAADTTGGSIPLLLPVHPTQQRTAYAAHHTRTHAHAPRRSTYGRHTLHAIRSHTQQRDSPHAGHTPVFGRSSSHRNTRGVIAIAVMPLRCHILESSVYALLCFCFVFVVSNLFCMCILNF